MGGMGERGWAGENLGGMGKQWVRWNDKQERCWLNGSWKKMEVCQWKEEPLQVRQRGLSSWQTKGKCENVQAVMVERCGPWQKAAGTGDVTRKGEEGV